MVNQFAGDGRPQTPQDWQHRIYEVLDLFSPGAPIDEGALLAGRGKQIDQLVEVLFQRGQHAILYGERGVTTFFIGATLPLKRFFLEPPTKASSLSTILPGPPSGVPSSFIARRRRWHMNQAVL